MINWDAIGAVGEVVGAAGVIATLAYLALQIRHSWKATGVETYQNLSVEYVTTSNLLASDPNLSRIYNLGIQDYSALEDEDATQFSFYMYSTFTHLENAYYLHESRTLEEEIWEKYRNQISWYTRNAPGVVQWWKFTQGLFSAQFRAYVSEQI
jgi:hypothetical protein